MVFSCFFPDNLVSGRSKESRISVELRDVSKYQGDMSFNHPYFIDADRLRTILYSLRYREKGMLKKKTSKRIFLDREIDTLVPLTAESLSKADPHKEVFGTVTSEKTFLRDQVTTFSLFMIGKELNIAFSQTRSGKDDTPSFKDWKAQKNKEPLVYEGQSFWELVPGAGQRLMENHKNWLVIDIENKAFEPTVVVQEEVQTISPGRSLIEERLRKLEERVGLSSTQEGKQEETKELVAIIKTPKKEASSNKSLTQKIRELKIMLNEELISLKDYEKKKQEFLQEEPPPDKTVPDMLKELKGLKDEGLISEGDYEQWKKKLLEKL